MTTEQRAMLEKKLNGGGMNVERLTYRDANGEAWYSDAGTEVDRLHFIADMEDILVDDYDLDRLRELVEADREGRIKIYPKAENNTCGACRHFLRITGRRCGTCDVQSQYRDRYGQADDRRGTFKPSQSRKACKRFEHREE